MREISIKADATGKGAATGTVNGKQLRFNAQAVKQIGLGDKVHVSLASTSDDENAPPDRLLIRASSTTSAPRPLGATNAKWRDLNSEEVVRAARLPNGTFPIEYDEQNKVHYIKIESTWGERKTLDRRATKARNKEVAAEIKSKREAGKKA